MNNAMVKYSSMVRGISLRVLFQKIVFIITTFKITDIISIAVFFKLRRRSINALHGKLTVNKLQPEAVVGF